MRTIRNVFAKLHRFSIWSLKVTKRSFEIVRCHHGVTYTDGNNCRKSVKQTQTWKADNFGEIQTRAWDLPGASYPSTKRYSPKCNQSNEPTILSSRFFLLWSSYFLLDSFASNGAPFRIEESPLGSINLRHMQNRLPVKNRVCTTKVRLVTLYDCEMLVKGGAKTDAFILFRKHARRNFDRHMWT